TPPARSAIDLNCASSSALAPEAIRSNGAPDTSSGPTPSYPLQPTASATAATLSPVGDSTAPTAAYKPSLCIPAGSCAAFPSAAATASSCDSINPPAAANNIDIAFA